MRRLDGHEDSPPGETSGPGPPRSTPPLSGRQPAPPRPCRGPQARCLHPAPGQLQVRYPRDHAVLRL